jgi:multiple sugar transport system permease protein
MRGGTKSEARAALLLIAPAIAIIGLFFLLPAFAALLLSLTDFDIYALGDMHNMRLIGVRNYNDLLHSAVFWRALINTIYFTFAGVPLTICTSLGAALLVNAKLTRFKSIFRTIYFAPVVTTMVAVAIVWKYLYHPRVGLLNHVLGHLGVAPIDWLGDTKWAMPALILLSVWKYFGYTMIIFVAGLQSIPEDLYESARIDGANAWQQFRHVTIPMLAPTFLFVGIITVITFLQFFAEPYVMTRGGPLNATLSIVMLMYEQGFRWWNMGVGAAVAFVLFLLIAAGTLVQYSLQKGSRS